ncbi:sulfite exporter TauE/SafE family protein [Senegalia sp. (in: firmicutes)]|uniref:sulfite exporter TauE/SafE family protein n=1 Tax=Senegalia sp. (in: firmicutes) TaxID=1924098 RepID=UPI003F9C7A64
MNTLFSSITIFIASIVHGIAGFGLAQVAMGIMPLFRTAASVAVVSNFRVWWSVKDCIKPVIGLIVGLPLGLYVFNQLDKGQVRIAIGLVLLLAVILIPLGKQTNALKNLFEDKDYSDGWILPLIAGFSAGVLAGAVAIPGPPMILYGTFMVATNNWNGKKMKATFTAFFGTVMLYRVAVISFQGKMNLGLFTEALIAIPAMLLGVYVGIKIFEKIPQKIFNWIVIGMLTINAFILLFT